MNRKELVNKGYALDQQIKALQCELKKIKEKIREIGKTKIDGDRDKFFRQPPPPNF